MWEKSATGKREGIVYPLSPTLPSLPFLSILYHFFIAYAGYKQAFLLARLYMLARVEAN